MEKAKEVDYVGGRDLSRVTAIDCRKCGAKVQGGKFCPECGTATALEKTCAGCGTTVAGSPKFCPECGKPI